MKLRIASVLVGANLALGCRSPESTQPLDRRDAQDPAPEVTSLTDLVPVDDGEPECVRVPSGILNEVNVSEFCMDITETTTEQYRHCVDDGKCSSPSERCSGSLYHQPDRQQYPVNCVTQQQSAEYCAWRSRRLPTALEWQWEAQGGGENRPYPWGDALPTCSHTSLYFGLAAGPSPLGDCRGGWYPIGSYPRGVSLHGALDLQGNVSEWTSDLEVGGGIVKGVFADGDFSHEELEPSYNYWIDPNYPTSDVGFRCVRD